MKHLPSDKYTIAWFKLAEFISRGEKEKALGIYRLLALSINDNAFVNKLEGDILNSFNDKSAEDKYYKAAILYQKDEKFIESALIYENLLNFNSESIDYLNKLIDLYKKLNLNLKVELTLRKVFEYHIRKKSITNAIHILEEIEKYSKDYIDLYEQIVFESINQNFEKNFILNYINRVIEYYFYHKNKNNLQHFLSKLETSNKIYYEEALKQLKD